MKTFPRIHLSNNEFTIHTLGRVVSNKTAENLFLLLSNDDNLKYCSGMRINSKDEINSYITGFEKGFSKNDRYTYFITRISTSSIIGEITLTPPNIVKSEYGLENVWFIQYLLDQQYWDHGIMTLILKDFIHHIKSKIVKLGAICHKENISSIKVLEKLNFKNIDKKEFELEYFELSPE
tara:strand:+ start:1704 stop:2240 length:537 start_codon:yes stop_codon:yes gene_type:complete